MNSPTEIYGFLKFTDSQYEKNLVDDGHLFMNNLEYYQNHAKHGIFGDPDEGVHRSLRAQDYELYFGGQKIDGLTDRIRISSNIERNTFLFCLTQLNNAMLAPEITEFTPDGRFREFGSHVVLIPGKNWHLFTERLNAKLAELFKAKRISFYQGDIVTYVPESHNEALGPFRKFESFAWQQEWRLVIQTKEPADAFQDLKIGSIRDIVMSFSTEELMAKKFQVKPRET